MLPEDKGYAGTELERFLEPTTATGLLDLDLLWIACMTPARGGDCSTVDVVAVLEMIVFPNKVFEFLFTPELMPVLIFEVGG